MDTDTITELAGDLVDDGDTVELPDRRTARLRVEADDLTIEDLEDPETIGRIAPVSHNYRDPRPVGFNGAARKVWCGRSECVWWQPPADVLADAAALDKLRQWVRDRLELGYVFVTVEIVGPDVDAYRRPIVHAVASVGGVDELYPGLVAELLDEALSEEN